MDEEETAAPFPEGEKGGGDSGYGEHVPHDGGERDGGGEQFEKSEHTCFERTTCEKKWTDWKTFEITRTTTK